MRKTIITTLLEREKMDPSVTPDTTSNDPDVIDVDVQASNPEEAGENAIVGFAKEAIGEVKVTKTYTISQITPMTIMTSKSPDEKM